MEFDFRKIRPFNKSQNNGFEELICQLAHLERPQKATEFIRKEGAGGDAGIECFWRLDDGTEHGWQAKFFIDGMNTNRWGQITDAFRNALNKHKNLTKYYVCLPLDRTDSRKKGKGGKQVVSILDEWENYTSQWQDLAKEVERKIDFIFWGKHEITHLLTIDDPLYSGRALFWFNEEVLTSKKLKHGYDKARNTLAERYTPELNVELPISSLFDGLTQNKKWYSELTNRYKELESRTSRFSYLKHDITELSNLEKKWNNCSILLTDFVEKFRKSIENEKFISNINSFKNSITPIQKDIDYYYDKLLDISLKDLTQSKKDKLSNHRYHTQQLISALNSFHSFLKSNKVSATTKKSLILSGEAGIGKSHLFCDVAKNNLSNNIPTILFLGQHYTGQNPLRDVLDQLDLRQHSYNKILGAIDAAGEACKVRALILIDAINEGTYKNEWYHRLDALLTDIKQFPHIAIAISCRSTYLDYLIPKTLLNNETHIIHKGFQGYEAKAASIYLSKQGITTPSVPFSTPEFSNPLFLKVFCKGLIDNGKKSLPDDQQSITEVFGIYLDNIEKKITRERKLKPQDKIVKKAAFKIADALYPDHLSGIPWEKARELIDSIDTKNISEETLLEDLISEGLLTEDINYTFSGEEKVGQEVVRFTYERFSDHFVASTILKKYQKIEQFEKDLFEKNDLSKLIFTKQLYTYAGILSALSIQFSEKFDRELYDFIPEEKLRHNHFEILFKSTLIWRSKSSFTNRTLELFNSIKSYAFTDQRIAILLRLSCRTGHPWNAKRLHKSLSNRSMAERDEFWSIPIAIDFYEENDEQPESISLTVINWALNGQHSNIDEKVALLSGIVLLWFTTTTNRKLRDKSTKAFVRILVNKPKVIIDLLELFSEVDDLYLQERLYAGIYGVILNIDDSDIIRNISERVYKQIFQNAKPIPHLLLRDYARGVLEYAENKKSLAEDIDKNLYTPPYNSNWPLENPSEDELDSIIEEEHSSIKSSLLGFVNDFGHYTMSSVHDWSPTSLKKENPQTQLELLKEFGEQLPKEVRSSFEKLIEIKQLKKNKPFAMDRIIAEDEESSHQNIQEFEKEYIQSISQQLSDAEAENLRWLSGSLLSNQNFEFSRKWAQRWVCKRAYELGWTKEKFEGFERTYTKNANRSRPYIERIGKKYQRIAYHEFLAHLADNVHYIRDWHSNKDTVKYEGPWQSSERDIDPTIWIEETNDPGWDTMSRSSWWCPISYSFTPKSLDEKKQWLWSTSDLPDFKKLLLVTDPSNGFEWYPLRGYNNWKKNKDIDEHDVPEDIWFRINSCIIKKRNFKELQESIIGKSLVSPDLVAVYKNWGQGFYGEYPWHLPYSEFEDYWDPAEGFNELINVKYIPPVAEYNWSNSEDLSLKDAVSIYLPSPLIVQSMNLKKRREKFGVWEDSGGEIVYQDPSIYNYGRSYGLIRKSLFNTWLSKNDLQIVWLVGGEKQLFHYKSHTHYGRLNFSGLFTEKGGEIEGDLWHIEEKFEQV